jgi:hypothetical protein
MPSSETSIDQLKTLVEHDQVYTSSDFIQEKREKKHGLLTRAFPFRVVPYAFALKDLLRP